MNGKSIIAALSVVLLICSPGVSAEPMADKVPAETLVYIGWAGRSLTFDGSMLGQLLAEPGVKDLFAAIKDAAGNAMAGDPDAKATFESLWAMGGMAWKHPAALALLDITVPQAPPGGPQAGSPEPQPVGVLLIDLQKDRDAFAAELQKLLALAAKKLELSQATVGDLSYHSFDTPAGPCAMGFVGNIFFVSVGKGTPMKVAAVVRGKAKALSSVAGFAAAMKDVAGENVQWAYYLDVPRLLDVMEQFIPTPPAEAGAAGGESQFDKIVEAMGVGGVTAVAGAGNIVERGIHEKCRIFSPAPHRGVLMLMAGKPLGADALAGVPADADFVGVMSLDPAQMLAEIKRVAAEIDPEAGKQVAGVLAAAVEAVGMDIEKDLLPYMGDQWTIISAPSLGGTLTGTVMTVQLKDAAKFSAALAKLEAQLEKMLAGPPAATMPTTTIGPGEVPEPSGLRGATTFPAFGGGRPRPALRKYKSGDVEVHYVSMSGGGPIPVAPAWAVHKGKLYLSAWPQVVAAAAGGTTEKPLASSETFAAFRKRLAPNVSGLSYTNTPRLVRGFYGVVLLGGTALTNLAGRVAPAFRPEILPPLPKVEKYVWPDIAAVSADDKGITIESYGSLPSLLSSTLQKMPIQGPALGVSILVPSLSRARGLAKRALSASYLNGIFKGIVIYGAEHDDRPPPDLATLVKDGYITAKMLYSPSSGRTPRLDAKGKPLGEIDYVYLGAQLGSDAPGDLILAYERPEINRGEGTNVLYVAGNVAWVTMAEFNRDLQRTREYIKKRKAGGEGL